MSFVTFVFVLGSPVGIFVGLLTSMLTLLLLSSFGSTRYKGAVLTGKWGVVARCVVAALATYTLVYHGAFGLFAHLSSQAAASRGALITALWATIVSVVVAVYLRRAAKMFIGKELAIR